MEKQEIDLQSLSLTDQSSNMPSNKQTIYHSINRQNNEQFQPPTQRFKSIDPSVKHSLSHISELNPNTSQSIDPTISNPSSLTENGIVNSSDFPHYSAELNHSSNSAQSVNHADARHELRFLISSSQVGSVIGKSGSNVKHVRDVSGCYVSILKTDWQTFDRVLVVRGAAYQASVATSWIARFLLQAMKDRGEIEDDIENVCVALQLLVHRQIVGSLIGKAGVIIKATQQATGVKIQVGNEVLMNSTEKAVTLYGTPRAIQDAMMCIIPQISAASAKIQGRVNRPYIPPSPAAVAMQAFNVHAVEHPMHLTMPYMSSPYQNPQQSLDAFSHPPDLSDHSSFASTMSAHSTPQLGNTPQPFSPFFGFASPPFVPEFSALPGPMYSPFSPSAPSMMTHTIVIPTRSAGQILGKGGEIIRTLRTTTGCHISIEEESELRPGERIVTLTGSLPGITAAGQFILSQLSAQRGVAPMPGPQDEQFTSNSQVIYS